MRKNEIQKGKTYTDGRGNVRVVLDLGPQYTLYDSQEERDNLQYKLLAKKKGPHPVGKTLNSTRASFATWAKRLYDPTVDGPLPVPGAPVRPDALTR